MRSNEKQASTSRRKFLQGALNLGVGTLVGSAMVEPLIFVQNAATDLTGVTATNAGLDERVRASCSDTSDMAKCGQEYLQSPAVALQVGLLGPVVEEMAIRVIPSVVLDSLDKSLTFDQIIENVRLGNGRAGLTRREALTGFVQAILFAGLHNMTDKGIDTKTLPVSQFIGGMTMWYLQRRFGFLSNTAAHIALNTRAIIGIRLY